MSAFVCFARVINEANQASSARHYSFDQHVETLSPPCCRNVRQQPADALWAVSVEKYLTLEMAVARKFGVEFQAAE